MPNTSTVDKKQSKKSKEGAENSVIPEKKGKKSKTLKDEAQRAEEEPSSREEEKISSEKKKKRKKSAECEGSAGEFGSSTKGLKESSKRKSKKTEGAVLEPLKAAPGPVKRISAAETSQNTSDPSRSSKPIGAHEANVPKQKKRSYVDDEPMASMSTVAKKLKLNDGGAAAAPPKVKEPSTKRGKYLLKEEEKIVLEDSSDEDVEEEEHIHGFLTDGDSSDDEAMIAEAPALDVSQLPIVAKDDATVQKRLRKAKNKPVSPLNFDYYVAYPSSYRRWIAVYST